MAEICGVAVARPFRDLVEMQTLAWTDDLGTEMDVGEVPDELREQWMQDAANALALLFMEIQSAPMESGALYHAVHGLVLYHDRLLGPTPPPADQPEAKPDPAHENN